MHLSVLLCIFSCVMNCDQFFIILEDNPPASAMYADDRRLLNNYFLSLSQTYSIRGNDRVTCYYNTWLIISMASSPAIYIN